MEQPEPVVASSLYTSALLLHGLIAPTELIAVMKKFCAQLSSTLQTSGRFEPHTVSLAKNVISQIKPFAFCLSSLFLPFIWNLHDFVTAFLFSSFDSDTDDTVSVSAREEGDGGFHRPINRVFKGSIQSVLSQPGAKLLSFSSPRECSCAVSH